MHQFRPYYALIMLFAIVACSVLLRKTQEKLPLSWREKLGIGLGAFCGAMIGAKLPFVLYDFSRVFTLEPWFSDGKTIMCGILGGYFGVEFAKWLLEVRVKTGDSFAAPVAFAVAIGRVGCFTAGCCFGVPTQLPWGVKFATAADGGELFRHPTQLYESSFHTFMGVVLLLLAWKGLWRGQLIKLYILAYLAYRFFTEWIRPEPEFIYGLTAYQWAAICMAPIFIALWWRDASAGAATNESGICTIEAQK